MILARRISYGAISVGLPAGCNDAAVNGQYPPWAVLVDPRGGRRGSVMLPTNVFTSAVANLFTEAYEGSGDPASTWFTDNEPGCAVLGTLDRLSAEQASVSFGQGASSTIASHAEHLRW